MNLYRVAGGEGGRVLPSHGTDTRAPQCCGEAAVPPRHGIASHNYAQHVTSNCSLLGILIYLYPNLSPLCLYKLQRNNSSWHLVQTDTVNTPPGR